MKQIKQLQVGALFVGLTLWLPGALLAQSRIVPGISAGGEEIRQILGIVASLMGGIVGTVAFGRCAYKFADGDSDSPKALLTGVIATTIGAIATTFVN